QKTAPRPQGARRKAKQAQGSTQIRQPAACQPPLPGGLLLFEGRFPRPPCLRSARLPQRFYWLVCQEAMSLIGTPRWLAARLKRGATSCGLQHELRAEMLRQLEPLRLVVRADAFAVERVRPRQHFLVDEPTDDLPVLEDEGHFARAHLQHRTRAA